MARIQVLALTPLQLGPATETPFVLVIDRVSNDEADAFIDLGDTLKAATLARAVLMFDGELTVEAIDEELSAKMRKIVELELAKAV